MLLVSGHCVSKQGSSWLAENVWDMTVNALLFCFTTSSTSLFSLGLNVIWRRAEHMCRPSEKSKGAYVQCHCQIVRRCPPPQCVNAANTLNAHARTQSQISLSNSEGRIHVCYVLWLNRMNQSGSFFWSEIIFFRNGWDSLRKTLLVIPKDQSGHWTARHLLCWLQDPAFVNGIWK